MMKNLVSGAAVMCLLAGCGGGSSSGGSQTTGSQTDRTSSSPASSLATTSSDPVVSGSSNPNGMTTLAGVSASFKTSEGYTVDLASASGRVSAAEGDVSTAPPGTTPISISFNQSITMKNTTPGRQLIVANLSAPITIEVFPFWNTRSPVCEQTGSNSSGGAFSSVETSSPGTGAYSATGACYLPGTGNIPELTSDIPVGGKVTLTPDAANASRTISIDSPSGKSSRLISAINHPDGWLVTSTLKPTKTSLNLVGHDPGGDLNWQGYAIREVFKDALGGGGMAVMLTNAEIQGARVPANTSASCTSSKIQTKVSNVLTLGTQDPASAPWFVDNTPTSGNGFESALGYAIATHLGFDMSHVRWIRENFDTALTPTSKSFDLYLDEVTIHPGRSKNVDFSSSYYSDPNGEKFGAVLEKGSSLTPCVSQAINKLRNDGTLLKLTNRWLP